MEQKKDQYSLSAKDAEALRRPVRSDLTPDEIRAANDQLAALWPLLKEATEQQR